MAFVTHYAIISPFILSLPPQCKDTKAGFMDQTQKLKSENEKCNSELKLAIEAQVMCMVHIALLAIFLEACAIFGVSYTYVI